MGWYTWGIRVAKSGEEKKTIWNLNYLLLRKIVCSSEGLILKKKIQNFWKEEFYLFILMENVFETGVSCLYVFDIQFSSLRMPFSKSRVFTLPSHHASIIYQVSAPMSDKHIELDKHNILFPWLTKT